jgi:hypothetical protein
MDVHHSRGPRARSHHSSLVLNLAILVTCLALYGLNQFILKDALGGTFLQSYSNDILAGTVIVAYMNILYWLVGKEEYSIRSWPATLAFVFVVGLFWEFVAPLFRADSVTDVLDLLAYLAGGVLYRSCIELAGCKNETSV